MNLPKIIPCKQDILIFSSCQRSVFSLPKCESTAKVLAKLMMSAIAAREALG